MNRLTFREKLKMIYLFNWPWTGRMNMKFYEALPILQFFLHHSEQSPYLTASRKSIMKYSKLLPPAFVIWSSFIQIAYLWDLVKNWHYCTYWPDDYLRLLHKHGCYYYVSKIYFWVLSHFLQSLYCVISKHWIIFVLL